jgi:hypothetical protein
LLDLHDAVADVDHLARRELVLHRTKQPATARWSATRAREHHERAVSRWGTARHYDRASEDRASSSCYAVSLAITVGLVRLPTPGGGNHES